MKVIITGMTGFVGQNLSDCLMRKNIEVMALSLRDHDWKKSFPQKAEALIHLAGKAHETSSITAEEEYYTVNTDLTKQLFHAFLDADIRDFFYFSSVKAAADQVDDVLDEDYLPHPATSYGKSKLLAEQYLISMQLPEGKRLFVIRPCMIHGPGNKGNLNLLYNIVKKGLPWPLASFENRRSFLSIDNLNFLIEKIISEKGVPSGIYNFADDETLATNELVRIIARTSRRKEWLLQISPRVITFGVKVGDFLNLPLNSERLKKLTESYVVSNTKIKLTLGIERLPISAKDGMEKTIRSFSKNL